MRPSFWLAQQSLRLLARGPRADFEKVLLNPEEAFERTKRRILQLCARDRLPESVSTWSDWALRPSPWTKEKIQFFETTSGSSAAKKPIPYNKSLLGSFQRLFLLWASDVLEKAPVAFQSGRLFMSISPQLEPSGLQDDGDYLGPWLKPLLMNFLAADPAHQRAQDAQTFFRNVGLDLLRARDLEILSLWSPRFFLTVLDQIEADRDWFLSRLEDQALRRWLSSDEISWRKIWPDLKMLSSWTSGASASALESFTSHWPKLWIQEKGLLATEAPVTVPWIEADGALPFLSETLLELRDESGVLHPCYRAQEGQTYDVVISTTGGLLRYALGDRVRVRKIHRGLPVLDFLGRVGRVSDLVGEKLDESLVHQQLKSFFEASFYLAPKTGSRPGYVLFCLPQEAKSDLAMRVDQALCSIHHYGLARQLGQLEAVEIRFVDQLDLRIQEVFESWGLRRGDLKDQSLLLVDAVKLETALMPFLSQKADGTVPVPSNGPDAPWG